MQVARIFLEGKKKKRVQRAIQRRRFRRYTKKEKLPACRNSGRKYEFPLCFIAQLSAFNRATPRYKYFSWTIRRSATRDRTGWNRAALALVSNNELESNQLIPVMPACADRNCDIFIFATRTMRGTLSDFLAMRARSRSVII